MIINVPRQDPPQPPREATSLHDPPEAPADSTGQQNKGTQDGPRPQSREAA